MTIEYEKDFRTADSKYGSSNILRPPNNLEQASVFTVDEFYGEVSNIMMKPTAGNNSVLYKTLALDTTLLLLLKACVFWDSRNNSTSISSYNKLDVLFY